MIEKGWNLRVPLNGTEFHRVPFSGVPKVELDLGLEFHSDCGSQDRSLDTGSRAV